LSTCSIHFQGNLLFFFICRFYNQHWHPILGLILHHAVNDTHQPAHNTLYGGSHFHQINIQLPIARNLRKYREEAELSIKDFSNMLNITPDDLLDLERGTVISSRDLMVEFCRTLKVSESELIKADDFSKSSEEVELLELEEGSIWSLTALFLS